CELRNQRDNSKLMTLVWFLDLKFLCEALHICRNFKSTTLACLHAPSRARFLVRFCLDLFLSRRHADRTACAKSRGPGALSPVPARADFQGAGLEHFAVQPLPGEGPPYVARPRAVMRGVAARVPASRSLPAEQSARGPRGAGGARAAVGRGILPRNLSRAIRR